MLFATTGDRGVRLGAPDVNDDKTCASAAGLEAKLDAIGPGDFATCGGSLGFSEPICS